MPTEVPGVGLVMRVRFSTVDVGAAIVDLVERMSVKDMTFTEEGLEVLKDWLGAQLETQTQRETIASAMVEENDNAN